MLQLIALLLGCGHVRTLELPMATPLGYWTW